MRSRRSLRLSALALTVLALSACRRHAESRPEPVDADVLPTAWHDVALPKSTRTMPPPTDARVLLVDARGVRLPNAPPLVPLPPPENWPLGFDAAYKRSGPADFMLVPLADGLARVIDGGEPPTFAVAADRMLSYRLLVEVLFTLGKSVHRVGLVVAGPTGAAFLPIHLPNSSDPLTRRRLGALADGGGGDAGAKPSLDLAVVISNEGLSLKARGGNVAPGCKDTGPGITIPRRDGRQDLTALATCAEKVHGATPEVADEHVVVLTAATVTPLEEIISVADALRVSSDGGALFDDVMFGVSK